MTRLRMKVARALVLALLLLVVAGNVASASGPQAGWLQSVPDDPGYGLTP
ncbi:MAG TPA: hypothetical protein VI814_11685 [Candidatus Limnocylindria bacterium]